MGYAGRDEVAAALDELLEAERSGARVALDSMKDAGNPAMSRLIRTIHGDEARWCAMLASQRADRCRTVSALWRILRQGNGHRRCP